MSNAAHPGLTKTNLQISGPSHGREKPALMERLYKTSWRFAPFLWQEIDEGILPALYAAADAARRGRRVLRTARLLRDRRRRRGAGQSARAARNDADSRRLWELSEQLTGVSYPS